MVELLQSGEDGRARIHAVLLGFCEITPEGMAKLAAASLRKDNDAWENEPRVPAGSPDGGQWTSGDAGGEEDIAGSTPARECGGGEEENIADSTPPQESEQQDGMLHLPPGKRIDELGDLLEWIANSKPEDQAAIRQEIRRLYYDVGDIQGGDALNRALSDVLYDQGALVTRKAVLEDFELYTRVDPAEAARFSRDLVTGALLFGALSPPSAATGAAAAAEEGASVWTLGWAARGRQIETALGSNLAPNFPRIDEFSDGVATSIKSIDLNAATYQDATRLAWRLNSYVDQLAEFQGAEWGDVVIRSQDISTRTLKVAIPPGITNTMQQTVFSAVRTRATQLGIDVKVVPYK